MRSRSGLSAIYIIVGLSALLVSTSRAIPGPLEREASIRLGSTFFFVYVRIVIIYFCVHRGSQVTFKCICDYGKNVCL